MRDSRANEFRALSSRLAERSIDMSFLESHVEWNLAVISKRAAKIKERDERLCLSNRRNEFRNFKSAKRRAILIH